MRTPCRTHRVHHGRLFFPESERTGPPDGGRPLPRGRPVRRASTRRASGDGAHPKATQASQFVFVFRTQAQDCGGVLAMPLRRHKGTSESARCNGAVAAAGHRREGRSDRKNTRSSRVTRPVGPRSITVQFLPWHTGAASGPPAARPGGAPSESDSAGSGGWGGTDSEASTDGTLGCRRRRNHETDPTFPMPRLGPESACRLK